MTLIRSISGIRGTIGGKTGDGLTPPDMVKYASAFGTWVKNRAQSVKPVIVLGRDARISGDMAERMVTGTLSGLGIDVINLSLATTPTVEIAVQELKADAGIILTASHNPRQWNALKLLNHQGEFISAADGAEVLVLAEKGDFIYAGADDIGQISNQTGMDTLHIEKILALPLVDAEAIRKARFRVVVDAVNSVGGIIIPALLKALGVTDIIPLFCEPTGEFPHNPEPLPDHLGAISEAMVKHKADVGFVVDPDVDRLAIVNEDGSMFGEEYTLVAVSDYVLQHTPGSTVSNLSSTRALRDVTEKHDCRHYSAAVGEVNVVEEMKKCRAVIGGEGNGGVIYPELHYGRDALVGIALFLTHLALNGTSCTALRRMYPQYHMAKKKYSLDPSTDFRQITRTLKKAFIEHRIDERDGLWIGDKNGWVHIRQSNTEPIIRIYAEGRSEKEASDKADKIISLVAEIHN